MIVDLNGGVFVEGVQENQGRSLTGIVAGKGANRKGPQRVSGKDVRRRDGRGVKQLVEIASHAVRMVGKRTRVAPAIAGAVIPAGAWEDRDAEPA